MHSREDGQATVELVALLPVIVVVALTAWQLTAFGGAVWASHGAARAAAREAAVGGDAEAAARRVAGGRARVRVRLDREATAVVSMPVRAVVGGGVLGRVSASSAFERQR